MMNRYDLRIPPVIRFGADVSNLLPDILPSGARRVFLASGTHAVRSGAAGRLADRLRQSGRDVFVMDGIASEPPPAEVDRMIALARSFRADVIAALGGGSVIDCAKAAAALCPLPGSCRDYFSGQREIPGKGLFFAAVPTTAGTGAEMTSNSVLTDPETKIKQSLRSPFMMPDAALNDPELLRGMSPRTIACCGLDAFVQAAECCTSTKANPFSRALAGAALKKLAVNLPLFHRDPENADARRETCEGSMMTGIAFAQTGLGAVHGLAHPAGSLLKIPHGEACAILMPSVFRFNAETVPGPYAEMAALLGLDGTAEAFLDFSARLAESFGIPSTMRSFGLKREHFPFLIRNCRSGSMKSNPREMSDSQVEALLENLL